MPEADDRVVLSRVPLNAETRLEDQIGVLTPVRRHYVRSHFADPSPPGRIAVQGAVRTPLEFTLESLRALPGRSLVVTLECAGNGRSFLQPPAPGEQWGLGAVSTAEWTGVPLAVVLDLAELEPGVVDVLFRGADAGHVKDAGGELAFERSLPVADATGGDALIAYAMNGEPLPTAHGAPFRLVVPGRYGMASVKWLSRITALTAPFRGFYQADRYVIDGRPLGRLAARAVITEPRDGERLAAGPRVVRGYCWSGGSPVARVEVSVDGGATWRDADLLDALSPHAWREWRAYWDADARSEVELIARAVTADGTRQPTVAVRSSLGYANNGARPVRVSVA